MDRKVEKTVEKLKRNVHGEGNKEADRRFREAESRFVRSEDGKREIAKAGDLTEKEERESREAAEKAKSRAKAEDPAVRAGFKGPGK